LGINSPQSGESAENGAARHADAESHRKAHFDAVPATGTRLVLAHWHRHFAPSEIFLLVLDDQDGHIEILCGMLAKLMRIILLGKGGYVVCCAGSNLAMSKVFITYFFLTGKRNAKTIK
jgi:hypothetical protein